MIHLKEYILHQVREIKREMLVAIEGLSQEDLTSHEPGAHSPIAWIVEHCVGNMDFFVCKGVTGKLVMEHERRFGHPIIAPKPGAPYPSLDELKARWTKVLDACVAALEGVDEADLQRLSKAAKPSESEPLVESCLRVINHQNAHLRQIWCILGRRRVDHKFPTQETWLA